MPYKLRWSKTEPRVLVLWISGHYDDTQRQQAFKDVARMLEAATAEKVDVISYMTDNIQFDRDLLLQMRGFSSGWHDKVGELVVVTKSIYVRQIYNILFRIAGHMFRKHGLALVSSLPAAFEHLKVPPPVDIGEMDDYFKMPSVSEAT